MATLLRRYHAQPGQTVAMLGRWRTPEGRTSYEVAVEETAALPRESRILDLACEDGYLLDLLSQRRFSDLVGVDQSPEELSEAGSASVWARRSTVRTRARCRSGTSRWT